MRHLKGDLYLSPMHRLRGSRCAVRELPRIGTNPLTDMELFRVQVIAVSGAPYCHAALLSASHESRASTNSDISPSGSNYLIAKVLNMPGLPDESDPSVAGQTQDQPALELDLAAPRCWNSRELPLINPTLFLSRLCSYGMGPFYGVRQ